MWRHSLETGDPYDIEYRLKHFDGTYRWVLGRALPIRDGDDVIVRWFGTCTDIHEQKMALDEREIISQELSHRIKNIFAVIAGLVGFATVRFFDNMLANATVARITDNGVDNAVISVEPFTFVLGAFVLALISTVFVIGDRLQRDTDGLV